jgi:hypothetical protein
MVQVSAAESVKLYIGMQSCQVEQACLRCREVARLHQVVLSRSTAGTFVAEACLHSIKDGPHSLLVSSVAEAQADTSEDSVRRGQLEEVAAEEVEHIPVVDGDVDSVSRVSLASAEAYLMLAKDGDAAAGAGEPSAAIFSCGVFSFREASNSDSWRAQQLNPATASSQRPGVPPARRTTTVGPAVGGASSMTVAQLKLQLSEKGLAVSGNKAVLIQRLAASAAMTRA